MTREEILEAIKDLAKSQGYYGRLLRAIEEDGTILDTLEEQNFNDVAVLLFNCSDYIELVTVYESNGILKVLVRDSYQGDLDKEFFDKITDRFVEEEVRYVTFETLQNYIIDSISNIEYDKTRFTNFLWLGNQAMLSLKRRGK